MRPGDLLAELHAEDQCIHKQCPTCNASARTISDLGLRLQFLRIKKVCKPVGYTHMPKNNAQLSTWLENNAPRIDSSVSGTPSWKTGKAGVIGGNHDWVEVYDRGIWSFTGPTLTSLQILTLGSIPQGNIILIRHKSQSCTHD